MINYDIFRHELQVALRCIDVGTSPSAERVEHLLNGAASDAVHQALSKSERAKDGIFFSSRMLSRQVASLLEPKIRAGATVADPTCGAGDLLLGCMAFAPTGQNLQETIALWSRQLIGIDIHREFVATARLRLTLLAAEKHRNAQCTNGDATSVFGRSFEKIRSSDYFAAVAQIAQADCVVMNPPYYEDEAAPGCAWATGKTQIAARFVESVLLHAKSNQEIVAVLPDVLRSGTRYSRWRALVEQYAVVVSIDAYGRFDPRTDVDVFVLHMRKRLSIEQADRPKRSTWNLVANTNREIDGTTSPSLGDLFQVSVGAVVPHRHLHKGSWFPFLAVATAQPATNVQNLQKIRTSGSVHKAPFVVIRRTSSPSDARRIVATVVGGTSHVAVENHLIVVRPLDSRLSTCQSLIAHLSRQYVNSWVNTAIRCRHLTTATIKSLPLTGWSE